MDKTMDLNQAVLSFKLSSARQPPEPQHQFPRQSKGIITTPIAQRCCEDEMTRCSSGANITASSE